MIITLHEARNAVFPGRDSIAVHGNVDLDVQRARVAMRRLCRSVLCHILVAMAVPFVCSAAMSGIARAHELIHEDREVIQTGVLCQLHTTRVSFYPDGTHR